MMKLHPKAFASLDYENVIETIDAVTPDGEADDGVHASPTRPKTDPGFASASRPGVTEFLEAAVTLYTN